MFSKPQTKNPPRSVQCCSLWKPQSVASCRKRWRCKRAGDVGLSFISIAKGQPGLAPSFWVLITTESWVVFGDRSMCGELRDADSYTHGGAKGVDPVQCRG